MVGRMRTGIEAASSSSSSCVSLQQPLSPGMLGTGVLGGVCHMKVGAVSCSCGAQLAERTIWLVNPCPTCVSSYTDVDCDNCSVVQIRLLRG
jgi:hypothetical protein